MTLLSEVYDPTPAERTVIAREILTRWQTAGHDSSAAEYLRDMTRKLDAVKKAATASGEGHNPGS
jgi:hypothetical protein